MTSVRGGTTAAQRRPEYLVDLEEPYNETREKPLSSNGEGLLDITSERSSMEQLDKCSLPQVERSLHTTSG